MSKLERVITGFCVSVLIYILIIATVMLTFVAYQEYDKYISKPVTHQEVSLEELIEE